MMKRSVCVTVAIAVVSLCRAAAGAGELSYFRADRGLAAPDDRPLPERLDSADALVWRQPLPFGHSTPCVYGDAVYLTTFDDGKLNTVALDRATGRVRWSKTAPTPACDGKRLYSFFGSHGMLCYDLEGNLIWSKPVGPFQDEFGSASSPVLVDGKLLLNEDHDLNNFLLCVDAATGKTLWQTPREGFTRSYSTPVIWNTGTRKQVVVAGALQLVGYDLETGKPLWSVDGLARIVNTTPTIDRGLLFVATWSPGGDAGARIAMEPWDVALKLYDKNGDGKLSREEANNKEVLDRFYRIDLNQDQLIDEVEWKKYARVFELARNSIMALKPGESPSSAPQLVWQYDRGIPYVPSPLVYRGMVFLAKDGGIVTSLAADSGKVLKQARVRGAGSYYSSPVAGDGKVYVVSEQGMITVLRAAGDWEVISSHDLGERTVATPVIVDGKIYLRTEQALYCFTKR